MKTAAVQAPATWANARERGVYGLMWLMYWGLRILRRPILTPVVRAVILYFFCCVRSAREASLDYLRRVEKAFPAAGLRPDWRTSLRHFSAFGDAILDKFDAWAGRLPAGTVVLNDDAGIHQDVAVGRGGLIIGAHLGNAEVCRAVASINRFARLNVLAHTHHAVNINRLLGMAGASQFELLQVTAVDMALVLRLRERISAGEWVVIAGDRVAVHGGRSVGVCLLDAPAALPIGPYVLGAMLECRVVLMFCLRRAGVHQLYFESFADKIAWSRLERDTVIRDWAGRFAERLEHYMQLEPLQWFNFYKFWSATAAGSAVAAGRGGARGAVGR